MAMMQGGAGAAEIIHIDPGVWRDAIKKAMNDDEWRTRLAKRARQDVNAYSWRKRVHVALALD